MSATQMFAVCNELESIYANEYDNSTITTRGLMFANSYHIVSNDGTVPSTMSSFAADCFIGIGGLLVDPDDDQRLWFWGHVYSDGSLEITASSVPDGSKTLVSSGHLCTIGKYNTLSAIPWYGNRSTVTSIAIKPDMAVFSEMRLNYMFYGLNHATSVSGIQYLRGVMAMRYTFSFCTTFTQIDLRGFDPS